LLTDSKNEQVPFSISPNGKRLAFAERDPQTNWDLWTLTFEDGGSDRPKFGKPEPFLHTAADERWPMISPDGRWLAYGSDELGRFEVFVQRFSGPGGKWQVSTGGGERPVWSKNGRELFYRSSEGMMVASYTANGEAYVPGKPRLWAAKKDLSVDYDVAPDGKRFAVVEAETPEQGGTVQLTFLLNFFDEVQRRVAAGP
jgi:Tol biopolymer transport system component